MNDVELTENLGTIARSGTTKFLDSIKKNEKNKSNVTAIGQFGVGFYASFMVATLVQVDSKKANEKESWIWESDGKNNYTIDSSKKKTKGTSVKLLIKKNAEEFLDFLQGSINNYKIF